MAGPIPAWVWQNLLKDSYWNNLLRESYIQRSALCPQFTQNPKNPSATSPILLLPAEIRNKIYSYVLRGAIYQIGPATRHSRRLNILYVSRQLRAETLLLSYQYTTFSFWRSTDLKNFFATRKKPQLAAIKTIELHIRPGPRMHCDPQSSDPIHYLKFLGLCVNLTTINIHTYQHIHAEQIDDLRELIKNAIPNTRCPVYRVNDMVFEIDPEFLFWREREEPKQRKSQEDIRREINKDLKNRVHMRKEGYVSFGAFGEFRRPVSLGRRLLGEGGG